MTNRGAEKLLSGSSVRGKRCYFTLVETMVAVVVLLVLMMSVLRFFSGTQKVWSATGNLSEIYENSRVALDVVTRDLQAVVARQGDILETSIRFYQPVESELCFVAVGAAGSGGNSQYVEVCYRLEDNEFKRASRNDSDAGWNVYGARGHVADDAAYEQVVEGVIRQAFVCYGADGVEWEVPSPTMGDVVLPAAIGVTFTLLDPKSMKLYEQLPEGKARDDLVAERARTVSKTISIGQRF